MLLALLLRIPGLVVVINGEPRWMNILGFTFQPSEIAKICLIAYTAFILSRRNWFTDKQMFWWIQGMTAVIFGLIVTTNGYSALLHYPDDDVFRAGLVQASVEMLGNIASDTGDSCDAADNLSEIEGIYAGSRRYVDRTY